MKNAPRQFGQQPVESTSSGVGLRQRSLVTNGRLPWRLSISSWHNKIWLSYERWPQASCMLITLHILLINGSRWWFNVDEGEMSFRQDGFVVT